MYYFFFSFLQFYSPSRPKAEWKLRCHQTHMKQNTTTLFIIEETANIYVTFELFESYIWGKGIKRLEVDSFASWLMYFRLELFNLLEIWKFIWGLNQALRKRRKLVFEQLPNRHIVHFLILHDVVSCWTLCQPPHPALKVYLSEMLPNHHNYGRLKSFAFVG